MPNPSAPLRLWISTSAATSQAACPTGFASAFTLAGVDVVNWHGKPESFPGVVVVEEVSPEICRLICFASDGGRLPVFVVLNRADIKGDWVESLLKSGAEDVLINREGAPTLAASIIARVSRRTQARSKIAAVQAQGTCLGSSTLWTRLLEEIVEATSFADSPVLLTGESGTGKEGVARLVHQVAPSRCDHSFVIVDCTTLSEELSGSELFGHTRGAFTGALTDRDGALQQVKGGTLFLDEIGELPLSLQAELLRVLQEKSFKPVGSNIWKRADFRLVSATNRDLRREVSDGRFRHDLYFRIAGGSQFHLPPLRERRTDILELSHHFLRECGCPPSLAIPPEIQELLLRREFPGNVRELKSVIQRIVARYCGVGPLTLGMVPRDDRAAAIAASNSDCFEYSQFREPIQQAVRAGLSLKEIGRTAEDLAIAYAVDMDDGNLQQAAKRLGLSERAVQMRVATIRQAKKQDYAEIHQVTSE